jgi:glycosyltransferase involved in cell wall biosynthesis
LRSGWDLFNALTRVCLVGKQRFDIVHAFESRPVVLLPALRVADRGVPLVMDWCDWFGKGGSIEERPSAVIRTLLRPVETFFEEHFRTRALATTVICSTLYDRARQLGVRSDTIEIVPNGFDIPGWKPYEKQKAREMLGFSRRDNLIGYVGSLFPQDACLMAAAFNLIVQRLPECRLVHIGTSRYSVRNWIAQPERLVETGQVDLDEMSRYLAACDICWLPFKDTNANRGRFPMKFTNYLAAGKAVIGTNVGDIPRYIEDNGTGLVVSDEMNDLAGAALKLLLDKDQRKAMESAAHDLSANSLYGWEARSKQIETIYTKLVSKYD